MFGVAKAADLVAWIATPLERRLAMTEAGTPSVSLADSSLAEGAMKTKKLSLGGAEKEVS